MKSRSIACLLVVCSGVAPQAVRAQGTREDYQRAGIRMLPVVHPDGEATARQIVLYSLALIPVSLLPTLLGMAGRLYFAGALALGVALFYVGVRLATFKLAPDTARSKQRARQLLQATVFYLPLLFALMMLNPHP